MNTKMALVRLSWGFFVLTLLIGSGSASALIIHSAETTTNVTITDFKDSTGASLGTIPANLNITAEVFGILLNETFVGTGTGSASGTSNVILGAAEQGSGPLNVDIGDGIRFTASTTAKGDLPGGIALTGVEQSGFFLIENLSSLDYFVEFDAIINYVISANSFEDLEAFDTGFDFVVTDGFTPFVGISERIQTPGSITDTFTSNFSVFAPANDGAAFGLGSGTGSKITVIPEPGSLVLLSLGLYGLFWGRLRLRN